MNADGNGVDQATEADGEASGTPAPGLGGWSVNRLAASLGVPATALSPVVDRLLASGMLAITEDEKLLPGRELNRIRIGDILSAIRENRDIPGLVWEAKVSALTARVNDAISGATGDTTLADMLD